MPPKLSITIDGPGARTNSRVESLRRGSAIPTTPLYSPTKDEAFKFRVQTAGGVLSLSETNQSVNLAVVDAKSALTIHKKLQPVLDAVVSIETKWSGNLDRIVRALWEERRNDVIPADAPLPRLEDVTFRVFSSGQIKLGNIERAMGEVHLATLRLGSLLRNVASKVTAAAIVRILSSNRRKDLESLIFDTRVALRDLFVAISLSAADHFERIKRDTSPMPMTPAIMVASPAGPHKIGGSDSDSEDSALADEGKPDAQDKALGKAERAHTAGERHLYGLGVQTCPSTAFRLFRKAAGQRIGSGRDKGSKYYAPAWYQLGALYQSGRGTEVDLAAAVACFRMAAGFAASGEDDATVGADPSGTAARRTSYVDSRRASTVTKDVAVRGMPLPYPDARAVGALARCYAAGQGVRRDIDVAAALHLEAARAGVIDSMFALGELLERGVSACDVSSSPAAAGGGPAPTLERNPAAAKRWYETAAQLGNAAAANALGNLVLRGAPPDVVQNPSRAVQHYRKAARAGHAAAQNNLGVCYETGVGIPRDLAAARAWYARAAASGHAGAIANAALLQWRSGDRWGAWHGLHRAVAAAEVPDALYHLAVLYETGICEGDDVALVDALTTATEEHERDPDSVPGEQEWRAGVTLNVPANPAMALSYLQRAARLNHLGATIKLAEYVRNGTACEKDPKVAEQWAARARALQQGVQERI